MKQSFVLPALVGVLLVGAGLFFVFSKKQEMTIVPGQQVVSPERKTYTKNIYLQATPAVTLEPSPTVTSTPTISPVPSVGLEKGSPVGISPTVVVSTVSPSPLPTQAKTTVAPTAVVVKKSEPPVTGTTSLFVLIGGIFAMGLIAVSFVL